MINIRTASILPNIGSKDIDFLMIIPSVDWQTECVQKNSMRIEKSIPNQEVPPLNIAYILAALKQKGYIVKCIDMIVDGFSVDRLKEYIAEAKPCLIGFTAFTKQICDAGEIAASIKQEFPESVICAGGPHVFALPVETLEEFPAFDFVVRGEAELIMPGILKCIISQGRLSDIKGVITRGKKELSIASVGDINSLPLPAWEEFDFSKYPGATPHKTRLELPMITSRGCSFKCTFCCRANGDDSRRRSVESVIAEIEHNIDTYGCEAIHFFDENFIMNGEWPNEFFKAMISRGLNKKVKWSCALRVTLAKPEMAEKMREAGCYYVFLGFESANEPTLKRIKKGISVKHMKDAVLAIKRAGIVPTGAFMIGLPGDTEEEVFKAIELGKELDLYSITFPIAVPYPGTKMREEALKNMYGMRILTNKWNLYGKKEANSEELFEVMESDDLGAERRIELKEYAYSRHPKKSFDEYVENLRKFSEKSSSE